MCNIPRRAILSTTPKPAGPYFSNLPVVWFVRLKAAVPFINFPLFLRSDVDRTGLTIAYADPTETIARRPNQAPQMRSEGPPFLVVHSPSSPLQTML